MYQPEIIYTDKLVNNLIKLENLRTSLAMADLSYNVKHKIGQRIKAQDLFHFSHTIGVDLTLKEAERISMGSNPEEVKDERNYIIKNFRNVLEFNRSNIADTYGEFDSTILLHLNKLAIASWRESWESRYRRAGDTIKDQFDNWKSLRDQTVAEVKVESEIFNLVEWYKSVTPTVPAVVRIALAIYRLVELSPFAVGNKFSIMAIGDYLFIKNGLSAKAYSSFVKIIDQENGTLINAFEFSVKENSVTYWLEFFSGCIIKDLLNAKEKINEYIAEDEKSQKQPFLDLNKRQLKVLRYLQSVPTIKREDYCHMMECSTMTAFRDLNDLVRKKLLKVDGIGRGTKYRLTSA